MSTHKQQAREVLDRLRQQILSRLPEFASEAFVEMNDLASLASVTRDYMEAERDWHDIPEDGEEDGL